MKPKIFVDTNCLLKAFLKHKTRADLQSYMDGHAFDLYTFEKCIFEAYSVFRGVHGKKPLVDDKGKWSSKFLKEDEVSNIDRLTSKYHDGDKDYALFMFNHVYEATAGQSFEDAVEELKRYVKVSDHKQGISQLRWLYELANEKNSFEILCHSFRNMLDECGFTVLSYVSVFDPNVVHFNDLINPCMLDRFAIETAFPPEDFEIVYSALRIPCDAFVTEDNDVIRCAKSLGLNSIVSPRDFVYGESGLTKWLEYWNADCA